MKTLDEYFLMAVFTLLLNRVHDFANLISIWTEKHRSERKHIPLQIVPPPQVSVSPYPWPTGQQKHTFMKYWVSWDSGAPPLTISRTLPPSNLHILAKMNLERVKGFDDETQEFMVTKRDSQVCVCGCGCEHLKHPRQWSDLNDQSCNTHMRACVHTHTHTHTHAQPLYKNIKKEHWPIEKWGIIALFDLLEFVIERKWKKQLQEVWSFLHLLHDILPDSVHDCWNSCHQSGS